MANDQHLDKWLLEWLQTLHEELLAKARRAGLLGHSTMIGDAREFFVHEVLKSCIPAMYEVGHGRVLLGNGVLSPQIDVIIHDSRFPVFRIAQEAVYPIEGVVAAVEVKSRVTRDDVEGIFRTCKVFASSQMEIRGGDFERLRASMMMTLRDESRCYAALARHLVPKVYLFGYAGLTSDGLRDAMSNAVSVVGTTSVGPYLIGPSVVLSGESAAVLNGDGVELSGTLGGKKSATQESWKGYFFVEQSASFSLIAAHLLDAVSQRSQMQDADGVRKGFSKYSPLDVYLMGITSRDGIAGIEVSERPFDQATSEDLDSQDML